MPASDWKHAVPAKLLPEKNSMCSLGSDVYMVGVSGAVPSLMHLSPRLFFHTLYYRTESDRRVWLQQRPYCSLNPISSTFVLITVLSFSVGKQNSISWREITSQALYTFFNFRQALLGSTHFIYCKPSVQQQDKLVSALRCVMWGTKPTCARGHACLL